MKLVKKHWRFFLLLAGILFVWIARQEVINRLLQIESIVKRIVHVGLLLLFTGIVFWIIRNVALCKLEKKKYKYVLIIPHMSDDTKVDQLGDMKSTKAVVKGMRLVSVTYVSAGRCRRKESKGSILFRRTRRELGISSQSVSKCI
ncbi:hypothetical protein IEU_05372 [Bacillus mycoides]|nr:hypothetical protein IEW_05456 [Bacillus mycoides]EJQ57954.1 hypothetical protein IEY_05450 [Bacillus mycoides]EJV60798.1 hypothetical protein IEU_05372 [Bacillus mycoides]MDR4303122.1 hypothetical protein [Bacillus mycoides]